MRRYYLAPKGASIPSSKQSPPEKKQVTRQIQQVNLTAKASPSKSMSAPRGVPTLKRWKRNNDSSITGFISGSPRFKEGEKVTTSPITNGAISSGEVVKTGSGSSYFLA